MGGFELRLDPDMSGVSKGTSVVAYGGVKDALATDQGLLELGAKKCSEVQDVGGGVRVASATDPLGNVLGVI